MLSLYLPGPSWLHSVAAGWKLAALLGLSILLYQWPILPLLLGLQLLTLWAYCSLGSPGRLQLRRVLQMLAPLFGLIFLLQGWLLDWNSALILLLRMLVLVLLANLISLTTTLEAMLAALTPLFAPLAWMGWQPARFAFAISLFIRFVPVLLAVLQHLHAAWQARGGGYQLWRLAIPLTIQTLRMSDQVAEALAARGGIPTQGFK